MIKLAIVGYGKMGKEIESLMDPNKFELVGRYDIKNPVQNNLDVIPDVAIEFSTPTTVYNNLEFLASKGINIVCGTTGWYDKIRILKSIIEKYDTGFIYAGNFSIGVNLFLSMINNAVCILNKFSDYDIAIEEIHHNQKLDRPSATALKAAEIIIKSLDRKTGINKNGAVETASPELIDISSLRVGKAVGKHKVIIDGVSDSIILEHTAKSRRGFAEGALLAAEFIYDKKGFYKFEDEFKNLI
ncbi:MAG: 4-hydroxy-tetrahydrodipicolinate reductase [Ignavibacteriae bacterium]|nr:MAG: 4-hydroxy-tetrahydrodipicolinate reductase [Ignavibacteriota bacterium]